MMTTRAVASFFCVRTRVASIVQRQKRENINLPA
jgi:hypothetical protein